MPALFLQSGSLLQEADVIPEEKCLLKHAKEKGVLTDYLWPPMVQLQSNLSIRSGQGT